MLSSILKVLEYHKLCTCRCGQPATGTNRETTCWSEKAFRQRYRKSQWTEKTKYHY
jgi:hypothetical protein